jgi:hypothetical protein
VVRDPLRDISKQFQSLTGDMEKVIEQQALTQQQERQGDLETLWGQFNETIHSLEADLQLRDEHYQERITTLPGPSGPPTFGCWAARDELNPGMN